MQDNLLQVRFLIKINTVIYHIATFQSMMDRIHDGGPIRL